MTIINNQSVIKGFIYCLPHNNIVCRLDVDCDILTMCCRFSLDDGVHLKNVSD